jgi:hypothetical protein
LGVVDLVTVIGVPIAILQLRAGRVQARRSFEQQFVDRYWAIEDDHLLNPSAGDNHRRRYFRLTEDQFELMRLGQISWSTWEVWHDGVVAASADLDSEAHGAHRWLETCRRARSHSGHDCPAVFEPDGATRHRSKLAPARWNQKVRRRWWALRSGAQEL